MHAILAAFGTDGDVFPFIRIGQALRERGHQVTLAANEGYATEASVHGFEFVSLVSEDETGEFLTDTDIWHPWKSALVAARFSVRFLRRQYESLVGLAKEDDTVIVAHPGVYAARVAAEKLSRPMASVVIMPWMIPSSTLPPIVARGLSLPAWAPRPLASAYWRGVDVVGDVLLGRKVNRLRRELGLSKVRRFFRWWLSPDLVLGTFPEWYGPPQPDWPSQMTLTGFPAYDGVKDELSAEVARFCSNGESPLVFTFGTGMRQGTARFAAAVDASQRLGRRAILVTRHAEQLSALPDGVLHCHAAPFGQLFPLAAAVIHHGGIGTTARALAAGVPQLITPLAFDQHDNAARVRRLGVGRSTTRVTGQAWARELSRLLTLECATHCQNLAARHGDEPDGSCMATMCLERFMNSRGRLSNSGQSRAH